MLEKFLQNIQDEVFGTNSNAGFFYEALQQSISPSVGRVTRKSLENIQINIHDSTSLLAQESVNSDTVVTPPTKSTRVKAYDKKTDTGTVRISAHIRKSPKLTLQQRFKILKSAVSKDKAPLKRPEVNVKDVVKEAIIESFQRLSI